MARFRGAMSRRRKTYERVTAVVLVLFVLFAIATLALGVIWVGKLLPAQRSNASVQPAVSAQQAGEDETANLPTPAGPLQDENGPPPQPWDGKSRITVLVMGLDERGEDEYDIPRTDTMILLSVDPASKTAGILSIPRDLWVNIPEMGYNKINTAYRWGEVYGYPGGGAALAMQTVEQFLGEPVAFYAQVDFMAFVRFIDELGGLTMTIREEIIVDPVGPGNTTTLQPGKQRLDGAVVLAYARMRYTEGGDFDRSERQQEVIMALRDQILSLNQLPGLIIKSPRLYRQLASGLRTNLTLQQIIQLAGIAAQVDEHQIRRGVISPPLQVEIAVNPADGQAILLPVPDQIQLLRDEIFSTAPVPTPARTKVALPVFTPAPTLTPTASGDLFTLMQAENARVMVKNGTRVAGLASQTGTMLAAEGIQVVGEENAGEQLDNTVIYDFTGNPYTVRYLAELMDIPESQVFNSSEAAGGADIVIILGSDWSLEQ